MTAALAESTGRITAEQVLAALDRVDDPELHEAVTALGFVASVDVDERPDGVVVEVHLRLPTYFCSANFAWLMVADAHDAVDALSGVRAVTVVLDDHFAAEPINAGVAARAGFVAAFEGEAVAELDELRTTFTRKAVLAATDAVCRELRRAGRTPEELTTLTLGDVPSGHAGDGLRARRAELGLPADDAARLLVDVETGRPLTEEEVPMHLRLARLTQVGVDANTSICRGQLAHRYDPGSTRPTGPAATAVGLPDLLAAVPEEDIA